MEGGAQGLKNLRSTIWRSSIYQEESAKTTLTWSLRVAPSMDREELRNRAMQFAIRAVRFCRRLLDTWEARRLGSQLIDSATSVSMNYRAAGRGRSRAEFIAKLGIVVEEADESVGWLELFAALHLATGSELTWLLGESRELLAIVSKSQKTAKENRQDRQIFR